MYNQCNKVISKSGQKFSAHNISQLDIALPNTILNNNNNNNNNKTKTTNHSYHTNIY